MKAINYIIGVDLAKPNRKDVNTAIIFKVLDTGQQMIMETIRDVDPHRFKAQVERLKNYYTPFGLLIESDL